MEDFAARRKRKEEARQLKRKRIDGAGGVRPRAKPAAGQNQNPTRQENGAVNTSRVQPKRGKDRPKHIPSHEKHRFGRVMERVPCRNKPRYWTMSIAIPGSVVSNCQTRELRTQLVGQIARAATVYQIDEIIVFDDKLAGREQSGYFRGQRSQPPRDGHGDQTNKEAPQSTRDGDRCNHERVRSDPHTFMARLLQYCECPQYLRKHFFPMHPDLQFSGLLAPVDAPHHVRVEERSKYREGVVLDKKGSGPDAGSFVNCGIRGRPVEIDRVLTPGIRCTVELDPKVYGNTERIRGKVVSPSAPREDDGTYWGYTTRLAGSVTDVFDGCPFEGGYDLKIGTSERGDVTVDDKTFSVPSFKHSLVFFGGVAGIDECVDADEDLKIPGSDSSKLFDMWVNTCPFQGSRTIRTEEAVLITLARLSPFVSANNVRGEIQSGNGKLIEYSLDEFSDKSMSDESSSDDE